MNVLIMLIPISITLGAVGLLAFYWSMTHHQYDDLEGDAHRILSDRFDKSPDGEDLLSDKSDLTD